MKNSKKSRNFRVSFWVSPTYYVPLFFRDRPNSFQWAKTQIIPLKSLPDEAESNNKPLNDAIKMQYDIPAPSIDEAIAQSSELINFILNIASFHYSVGLAAKSPVSIVDLDTGEGMSYDFHQLQITKEEFCTKVVQMYLPINIKDGTGSFKLSSDEILTYESSEIFKVDDFFQTVDLFKSLYFGYIKDTGLREKIGFSLNILKEAYQVPSFIPRFVLYWRAFEELVKPAPKSGMVNEQSLKSIVTILQRQERPKLSSTDIMRLRNQIKSTHRESKTDLVVEEMKKYFNDTNNSIKQIYRKLNNTRQDIIHTDYKGADTFEMWANTDQLKSIVRQIIKVHLGYGKTTIPTPNWDKILHVRDAPKPEIQFQLVK